MTATPTALLQAWAVDIANELPRRRVGVDELCSRLGVYSLDELQSLIEVLDRELLRRGVAVDAD
jgi:hypothetical protein